MSVPGAIAVVERYGGVEGVTRFATAVPGPRVALVGLTHGNETVGRLVAERFASVVHGRLTAGEVVVVLANLEAARLDRRHTPDGVDMNRLWHRASLARLAETDPSTLCYEERRVRELAPVLREAEVLLDLHSTSRPSRPHLVFRDDHAHAVLAVQLGVRLMVTGIHEGAILGGGLTPDLDLDPGQPGRRVGFTLEAGQHTDPGNLEAAWGVVTRLLAALGMWADQPSPLSPEFEVYEVIERVRQAPAGVEPWVFPEILPAEDPRASRSGRRLESFELVAADEPVLVRGAEVVRAEAPFTMLMPAPTAPPGDDLYYVCQRRHAAMAVRPPTDEQARLEAAAVERFTDLLRDDAIQRGELQVSFDRRRTLDLCADVIGRVARLPVGHPHRRITVVGRGDDDGSEGNVRHARRYHQALARAVAAGVPMDRIQLLQGAGLSWLRHVGALPGNDEFRLFLADDHPWTVSLLLCGDVQRALADGDYHHVRVALVVEAGTVEVSGEGTVGGAGIESRVVRAGVLGARPELVRFATGVVAALRVAHDRGLEEGRLRRLADAGFLRRDGSIRLPPPGDERDALQRCLLADVLAGWRTRLRPHVVAAPTRSGGALAHRLRVLMGATGIPDAGAIVRLAFEAQEGGWAESPPMLDVSWDVATWLAAPAATHRVPEQVLDATDVDRDNFERWMGWKRFCAEVAVVVGARGRDLDLAWGAVPIRNRVLRWYNELAAAASASPGRWRLVVVGDGLRAVATSPSEARLAEVHGALSSHPGLAYTRLQQTHRTQLGWLAGFLASVQSRPPGSAPVEIGWEAEHGGLINVILIARDGTEESTLEGWTVERAAVVLQDVGADTGLSALALFTEPDDDGSVQAELLHFARTHAEGLLRQATRRTRLRGGPILDRPGFGPWQPLRERAEVWILAMRAEPEERDPARWARRLGLVDPALAQALVSCAASDLAPSQAAAEAVKRARDAAVAAW